MSLQQAKSRMVDAIEALRREFATVRTGKASPALVDSVRVDVYGSKMPLNQVGTVNAPEARLLTVQVWDQQLVKAVEKSVVESNLGLNPQTEGNLIRIPIPDLSEERRVELKKIAGKYAEQGKIAIRNVRRDGMDTLKQMERDGEISQDEQKLQSEDIQKLTDAQISKIDATLESKETEIMQV